MIYQVAAEIIAPEMADRIAEMEAARTTTFRVVAEPIARRHCPQAGTAAIGSIIPSIAAALLTETGQRPTGSADLRAGTLSPSARQALASRFQDKVATCPAIALPAVSATAPGEQGRAAAQDQARETDPWEADPIASVLGTLPDRAEEIVTRSAAVPEDTAGRAHAAAAVAVPPACPRAAAVVVAAAAADAADKPACACRQITGASR